MSALETSTGRSKSDEDKYGEEEADAENYLPVDSPFLLVLVTCAFALELEPYAGRVWAIGTKAPTSKAKLKLVLLDPAAGELEH